MAYVLASSALNSYNCYLPYQHSYSVSRSITSYGNRPNDFKSVVDYFRAHFLQVHRKNNEKKRVLYSHLTNAVVCSPVQRIGCLDRSHIMVRMSRPHATSFVMVGFSIFAANMVTAIHHPFVVRDSIFRDYLKSAALV